MPIINDILFGIAFLVVLSLYLLKLPHISLNKGVSIVIIYYIAILISTVKNDSLNSEYFIQIAISLGLCLLVNYSLNRKSDFLNLLLAINILIYIYIVTNLLAMFLYPNGIPNITERAEFPNYIFGNTNNVIKYALPGLCFSFLYDALKYYKVRKRTWLLLLLVFLTLLKSWSLTAIFGLTIFTLIILNKIGKKNVFISYFTMFSISIGVTILLLFFRNEGSILEMILNLFGKDLTLTNRDIIWSNALESIRLSPVWGYGLQSSEVLGYYLGNEHGTHNYHLDTLFRGGLVSLSILLISIFYFSKSVFKSKSNLVTRILIATASGYFVLWIAEPLMSTEHLMFSILFVLFSRIDLILKYYVENNEVSNYSEAHSSIQNG